MVEKGADLRVVNDADQRDALPGGKDQRMQPHGDHERHAVYQGKNLTAGVARLNRKVWTAQPFCHGMGSRCIRFFLHQTEEGNQAIFAAGVFRRCGEGGNPFLKTLPCPQRQHDIVPAFLQTAAQQITARGVRRKRLAQ